MNKPLLLVQAPVSSRSGYGSHSRDLVRVLIESNKYNIKIFDLRWGDCPRNAIDINNPEHKIFFDHILDKPVLDKQPDIHIHITVPNEFSPIGRFNVGITAGMETTMISKPWVDGCNRMNLIIVPSAHCKNVFQTTSWTRHDSHTNRVIQEVKVTRPVEILFEGTRTDIFKHIGFSKISQTLLTKFKNIKENWCFLYVGHWLKGDVGQDRKDVGMLVKVFLETFKNVNKAPGLILKTSGATFSVLDRHEILTKIQRIRNSVSGNLPNIYVIHGDLTDEEMNGLYNHPVVKAHVSFTKGEGFGRPLLEASMSGKPIIASGWSGHVDFLDKHLSVLLPGELTRVHQSAVWDNVILKESEWFTVNYIYASQILKDVWKKYEKYKLNSQLLARKNKVNFSYEKMAKMFLELLDKYIPEFPKEVDINLTGLPTLKKIGSISENMTLPKLKRLDEVESANQQSCELNEKEQQEEIQLPKL